MQKGLLPVRKYLFLGARMKFLPVFFWRTALLPLEEPVEIRNIIITHFIGDFGNISGRTSQQLTNMGDPDFIQAFKIGLSRSLPDKPAEGTPGHIGFFCDIIQEKRFRIIGIHISNYNATY